MKNQWVENYVHRWKTYRNPLIESTRLLSFMSKIQILKIIYLKRYDVLCYTFITRERMFMICSKKKKICINKNSLTETVFYLLETLNGR